MSPLLSRNTGGLLADLPLSDLSYLPDPTQAKGEIAGIGSREAPIEVQRLARELMAILYALGYTLSSGGADGMDSAFEAGVLAHPGYASDGTAFLQPPMQVYLPWNGFEPIRGGPKKFHNPHAGYFNAKTLARYPDAQVQACATHPLGDKLRDERHRGSFALHTRNVFQIQGMDLRTPVKAVYFWAIPQANGTVKGGTNTAVALAKAQNIPTMNLADPIVFKVVSQYVMRKLEYFQGIYGA